MNRFKQYIFLLTSVVFTTCTSKKESSETGYTKLQSKDSVNYLTGRTADIPLDSLVKQSTGFIVTNVPVTTLYQSSEQIQVPALGSVQYDNREVGTVSSRIEGRIEKLYVHYRYQYINKGDKLLDIYSPELLTSQQNLLFVLNNDAENKPLINAAKQRLLLMGMTDHQLNQIISTGKPLYSVPVFSNYSGYVNEMGVNRTIPNDNSIGTSQASMQNNNQTTQELSVKEGMYLQKGQPVFTIVNANRAIIILNIYADQQNLVRVGDAVKVVPEIAPGKLFGARIDFIEPFFRPDNKTITARIYFDNSALKLPIGSQVQASIFTKGVVGNWLPASAVLSLGLKQVVFKKDGNGFSPINVTTGIRNDSKVQITGGLSPADSVAENAQYFIDKESIIKAKNQ